MRRATLIGLTLLWATAAAAHKPSDSYLTLRGDGPQLAGQWDIALRDLDDAIGLDGDGDGTITWGELRARHAALASYALGRLRIDADGTACATRPAAHLVDRHSDGAYAVLRFTVDCPHTPAALGVGYELFFDRDPQHRGLLEYRGPDANQQIIFSTDQRQQRLALAVAGTGHALRRFWADGVRQTWADLDLQLFLLALLLPSVLRREPGGWRTVGWRDAWLGSAKVVIAVALASSIALALSSFGALDVPASWLKGGIAASIAVAALTNTSPRFAGMRWLLGFGFGLVHGAGLADALAGLSGSVDSPLPALLGFNAGLATGLLVAVAAFLSTAAAARRTRLAQRPALVGAASLIAILAGCWLVAVALDPRLLAS